eukprot:GHVU01035544.1.p1 GENE.GHVU01035544.1~~GHVU01035544.1.p1  ORF type:complete len:335 (+),score=45.27 GHVU01035544.1:1646-2650(+)
MHWRSGDDALGRASESRSMSGSQCLEASQQLCLPSTPRRGRSNATSNAARRDQVQRCMLLSSGWVCGCVSLLLQVYCGKGFNGVLAADNVLHMWGRNDRGQLGLGSNAKNWILYPRRVPTFPSPPRAAVSKLSLGPDFVVACVTDASVPMLLMWGAFIVLESKKDESDNKGSSNATSGEGNIFLKMAKMKTDRGGTGAQCLSAGGDVFGFEIVQVMWAEAKNVKAQVDGDRPKQPLFGIGLLKKTAAESTATQPGAQKLSCLPGSYSLQPSLYQLTHIQESVYKTNSIHCTYSPSQCLFYLEGESGKAKSLSRTRMLVRGKHGAESNWNPFRPG